MRKQTNESRTNQKTSECKLNLNDTVATIYNATIYTPFNLNRKIHSFFF